MKEINIEELKFNPFAKIGKEWFLITAGNRDSFNTMTASWGFMGVMWGRNCIQAVVRPTRHTYKFLTENDNFTVSFFSEKYRDALSYCGSHSGRDVDKIKETGLTPVFDEKFVYFEEADLVICCNKLYTGEMNSGGLTLELNTKFNSSDPIHCQFIGSVDTAYVKE